MQKREPLLGRQPRAADLRIHVLGVPCVVWRERPLSLTRRQARGLLYRIAAERAPVSRDELCRLLAPDGSSMAARPLLSVLLSYLRRALPAPGILQITTASVALDHALVWTDGAAFEAGVRAAVDDNRLALLARAAELYRGPFLHGAKLGSPALDEWACAERARWERRYLELLSSLIEGLSGRGAYTAAIEYAKRVLAVDSLHEEHQRRLMELYARNGQRSLALRQYQSLVELLRLEMNAAPLPETMAAYEAIRNATDEAAVPAGAPYGGSAQGATQGRDDTFAIWTPAAPPAPLSRLLGRDEQVANATRLLKRERLRLLTLTGTGGSGKTRLALAIAAAVAPAFADGVVWLALGPLNDAVLALDALVQACGARPAATAPLDLLRAHLRDKQLLLVIDNFEHMLAAAPLLGELLEAAPGVQLLVTSRCPLQLPGEHMLEVPPLPLPDLERLPPTELLAEQPAVALLVERARLKRPGFALTAANGSQLAAICVRLDGLPLAIELAAARLELMSPDELVRRLSGRLSVLTNGASDLPERQRTLRNTIAWSYNLLDSAAQGLFAQLAVFAGGWTPSAAQAVGDGGETESVRGGLRALLNAHLIVADGGGDAPLRYTMLETIHEYALDRLRQRGDEAAVRLRHALYFARLAQEHDVRRQLHAAPRLLEVLDREYPNLRGALEYMINNRQYEPGARLVDTLHWYWELRGMLREGLDWQTRVLGFGALVPQPRRARVRALAALLTGLHGRHDEASALAALVLFDEEAEPSALVIAGNVAGTAALEAGDLELALRHLERSLALLRRHRLLQDVTEAEIKIALCLLMQGKLDEAEAMMRSSFAGAERLGQPRHLGLALLVLAFIAVLRSDAEQAAAQLAEAVQRLRAVREATLLPYALVTGSMLAAVRQQPGRAVLLFAAATGHAGSTGLSLLRPVVERAASLIEPARSQLGSEVARLEQRGQALELEQALDEMMSDELP